MAKRFNILKEFGRTTKKPKLDITIKKVQHDREPATLNANQHKRLSPVKRISPNSNNLWDDDDDDVILLATQVAESQQAVTVKTEMGTGRISVTATGNLTDHEITFSEFAPHIEVHATTSTQRPQVGSVLPNKDMLSDIFNGDDDGDFVLMSALPTEKEQNIYKEERVFKKPIALPTQQIPSQDIIFIETEQIVGTEAPIESETPMCSQPLPPLTQSVARRQLASERQIKFLMERVDVLKKQNTKLSNDLQEVKTKVTSKDGEANLLRDELRHMKQQVQQLKMQKLCNAEAVEMKCKTQIAEINKQMEATQTKLQFKVVECMKLRQSDEAKRLELTIRDNSMVAQQRKDTVQNNKSVPRSLMRLRNLSLFDTDSMKQKSTLDPSESIYEPSFERGISKRQQRTVFQMELEHMQTIVAQLQLRREQRLTEHEANLYTDKIMNSVCKVFPEFWSYVHSLEFPKNCSIHPYHDYNVLEDLSGRSRQSLHQPSELYPDERALSLRRYIASLAVVCHGRQLSRLLQSLLTQQHGEYLLVQICVDAVRILGFSREVCEHFGLIEALATFLHGVLMNTKENPNATQAELLFGFLKQIVFVRPTPWIFAEISFCVLECIRLPNMLALYCCNSGGNSFITDRVRSVYHFSNDSCLLQVYAGLLEIIFPLNNHIRAKHFELLTVICLNHVRFVYYCFANPPKFIHNNLPSYEDDDNDVCGSSNEVANVNDGGNLASSSSTMNGNFQTSSTNVNASCSSDTINSTSALAGSGSNCAVRSESSAIANNCECYTKLCLSVVTLVFQLLRQWIHLDKLTKVTEVSEISKIAVQLLHIIFCDNYLTRLFRDEEETTKHHLCMIYKWWWENMDLLQFNELHKDFLTKLQNSHIMPRQLNEEEALAHLDTDLREWHRVTSDDSTDAITVNEEQLNLIKDAGNSEKFFEGLKGYAFNFQ